MEKCEKCKTELFKCDIVQEKYDEDSYHQEASNCNRKRTLTLDNHKTHIIYRCPKCFNTLTIQLKMVEKQ